MNGREIITKELIGALNDWSLHCDGGAINVRGPWSALFTDSRFIGNSVTHAASTGASLVGDCLGGAISNRDWQDKGSDSVIRAQTGTGLMSQFRFNGCGFVHNQASEGGALFASYRTSVRLENSCAVANTGYGSAIAAQGRLVIEASLLAQNSPPFVHLSENPLGRSSALLSEAVIHASRFTNELSALSMTPCAFAIAALPTIPLPKPEGPSGASVGLQDRKSTL